MSFERGRRQPPVPLYSLLPQPAYTPLEHQRRDDRTKMLYEPRYERQAAMHHRREQAEYVPDYPDRNPYNDRVPQTPTYDYYMHQQPQHDGVPDGEPYRDPGFDYHRSNRYEPVREHHQAHNEHQRDQYPWDPHRQQAQRYEASQHFHSPRGAQDYMWINHEGRDDQHRDHPRERYNVPVETHPLSDQQRDYYDSSGYDTLQPAGLANKYDVKITDLLTSVMDKQEPGMTVQQMMEENKGYLVLARFGKDDISTFVNAVQSNVGILSSSYDGYVIGFAEPEDITVSIVSNDDRIHSDNSWFTGPRYAACCFWFKNIKRARDFFEGTNPFKQHDFPSFGKLHIVGVPLTYGRNPEPLPLNPETSDTTLMWTEFPSIAERGPDDFLYNYSEPVRQFIREHGGHPNVTVAKVKPGWPPELNKFGQDGYRVTRVQADRVGRNIRSGWLRPDSFITVSAFASREQLIRLFQDGRFRERRTILQRYTRPTILGITLRRVKGTRLPH